MNQADEKTEILRRKMQTQVPGETAYFALAAGIGNWEKRPIAHAPVHQSITTSLFRSGVPLIGALFVSTACWSADVAGTSAKWEKEIVEIEAADKTQPPPKGEILFIGSSAIRLWKTLSADFPEHKVINRGFGGSQIADATHFAPRIVFPCAPRLIFLRSGVNDINSGKPPEQVFKDYLEFVATVHARLPATRIVYLGLCPTVAHIGRFPQCDKLNQLIREHAAGNSLLGYVDCADMTLDGDGKPRPELFVADGFHFNADGYQLLAARTRPFLPAPRAR
jgi:lysophospholipase L1-like esterase